ncbi:uncharacterized protein LOC124365947 [Homalodisca vitripennis]|uniref:uncharacterized protein LOC124365947 n=1 Tax=Homalodisca vitripennis TaxID=197043 RepID=UPI001EEABB93|nr:uncharacterized protein LOC124365947 [Homalodisca vitripennis]
MYIDPKNPRHAQEEAETLVALSDVDHDGQLSLSEVLGKMDLFLGSKMRLKLDVGRQSRGAMGITLRCAELTPPPRLGILHQVYRLVAHAPPVHALPLESPVLL